MWTLSTAMEIAEVGKIENKEVKVFTGQMFMNNLFGCYIYHE